MAELPDSATSEDAIFQEELARLRQRLEVQRSRRSKHAALLQECDMEICRMATEISLEDERAKEVDKLYTAMRVDAVKCTLDFKAQAAETDDLRRRKEALEQEILLQNIFNELPRPLQHWITLSSGVLLGDDLHGALILEHELLDEARSGKDQDLESLLREIEILEVTNTQLRSFEPSVEQQPDSPNSLPRGRKDGRLHRFGRWLIGSEPQSTSPQAANLAAAKPGELLVDDLISCCWEAQQWQPGVYVKYPEAVLRSLLAVVREVFLSECSLLEIREPVNVCGDIHGQYHDLLRLFEAGGRPPASNYLFMGDYVDRGRQSIETITLLFVYKVKFPENCSLLRGNHECASITRMYGFYDECKRRYNVGLWKEFCNVFNCMPVCGLISSKIMCMHGGLSPLLDDFDEVRAIAKPADIPHRGIMCDLLWADPEQYVQGWQPSDRGVSYVFGANVVKDFVSKHGLDLICRAHQVVEDGYEFFADRRLVTVFSAPNYCGEFDNLGAFMVVSEGLRCKFEILRPRY